MLTPKARVLRDGEEKMIEAAKIVPGDIIILNEGDKIPADAILFESQELQADESILTGESVPVHKKIETRIFMGTKITYGTGRAVVVATGMQTEFGTIAELTTETKKDKTPLQKELQQIGVYIAYVTGAIAVVLIIMGFIQKREIVETILFAASVAVAAIPEGLPATVTIALALGVQRLARKKAIVKQLASVETLGNHGHMFG